MKRLIVLFCMLLVLCSAGFAARYATQQAPLGQPLMTKQRVLPGTPLDQCQHTAEDNCRHVTFPDDIESKGYVSPQKGFLLVRATADFNTPHDPLGDFEYRYVWVLNVSKLTPTAKDRRHQDQAFYHEYVEDEHVFIAPVGKRVNPQFQQFLPLEPGKYCVTIKTAEMMPSGPLRSSHYSGELRGPQNAFYATVR
jgi:hypothetical protein